MKKVIYSMVIALILLGGMYSLKYYLKSEEALAPVYPVVTVNLSTGQSFKIELYPDEAPNTVNNFLYLATIGFYDNTKVNRAIPDMLLQAGDPIGNGKGFPGYFIKSECKYNGTKNGIKHEKGTLSMARSKYFDTEGSQFFISLKNNKQYDGQYSAFGKVIEGIEIIEQLSQVETDSQYRPIETLYITNMVVETKDKTYDVPQIISVEQVLAQYEE